MLIFSTLGRFAANVVMVHAGCGDMLFVKFEFPNGRGISAQMESGSEFWSACACQRGRTGAIRPLRDIVPLLDLTDQQLVELLGKVEVAPAV